LAGLFGGINIGLATRMYIWRRGSGEFRRSSPEHYRATRAAQNADSAAIERDGAVVYTFDIHLQGDREAVFFDI